LKPILPPQTELARRALAEVIADRGEGNTIIPAGLKGVQERNWYEECYDAALVALKSMPCATPSTAPGTSSNLRHHRPAPRGRLTGDGHKRSRADRKGKRF
jgi:hypothetical protein